MPSLSLCLIVKNESWFLENCLSSAREFVDEIVVVDTGSTDDTREIAARFTDRVLGYTWHDHFADARNYSIDHASGDWIIVLDADEQIEPRHWRELRRLIADTDKDAFFLQQRNYSHEPATENWIPVVDRTPYTRSYKGYKPNPIGRLFRNNGQIRYSGRVHEVIDGSVSAEKFASLDIPIHHHMDEDPSKSKRDRQLNYLRIIEQELEGEEDGRLYTAAGSIRMHYLDDFEGAIARLQRAIELGHRVNENRESVAICRYRLGDLDGAYDDYTALHASGHSSVGLCNNLANLAVKREQFGYAADLLEEGLALGVADPEVRVRLEHNIRYLRDKA